MSERYIRRGELGPPGPSLELYTDRQHRVVIAWHKLASLLEFEDALFRTNSAVVMPSGEGPSASHGEGRRRTAVGIVAACLRRFEEQPGQRILLAGHTDTTGGSANNEELSRYRAGCVRSLLLGESERFASICGTWLRMGVADYQQILLWISETWSWDCDPGPIDGHHSAATNRALTHFRQRYNEVGPGSRWAAPTPLWGDATLKQTWIAYFNMYEEALLEELGCDAAGVAALRSRLRFLLPEVHVGCGESHPREAVNMDEYRSQTNRRVELLFFDPGEEPAMGCHPPEACVPGACELYDPQKFRRRILPVMPSARPWRARWSRPGASLKEGSRMELHAPGLPAGEVILFELSQLGHGPVAEFEVLSSAGSASFECEHWFYPETIKALLDLPPGAPFPQIRFTFTAHGGGRLTACEEPLLYADELRLRIGYEVGEEDVDHLDHGQGYSLFSPWGRRQGSLVTLEGEPGWALEEGLPPGGVSLVIADRVVI